ILGPALKWLPTHPPGILEILAGVLLFDLLAYAFHRLFHRIDFLFRFHRVHHSDPNLEVTTALRFHVFEVLPTVFIRILLAYALGISYMTLVIFEIIFQTLNFIEHSNIKLPVRLSAFLNSILVTPIYA